MGSKRSMITIATDAETKETVRRYAQAAGVDLSTYISAAISAAMLHDDQVARTFAPLDAMIDAAEERDAALEWPTPDSTGISHTDSDSLDRALDDFFDARRRGQGAA